MKRKWSLNKIISIFLGISLLVSCKKTDEVLETTDGLNEVEVFVYDASTGKGIPGITLFYSNIDYLTNAQGKVKVTSELNLKGDSVEAFIGAPFANFTSVDFPKDCIVNRAYVIENSTLNIPLIKEKKLKLDFIKVGASIGDKNLVCVSVNESENCKGQVLYIFSIVDNQVIDSHLEFDGSVFFSFFRPDEEISISFYNGVGCSVNNLPDSVYKVPVSSKDTTEIVLYF